MEIGRAILDGWVKRAGEILQLVAEATPLPVMRLHPGGPPPGMFRRTSTLPLNGDLLPNMFRESGASCVPHGEFSESQVSSSTPSSARISFR